MKKGLSIALIFCFVLGLCAAALAEPPSQIPTIDIPVAKTWDDEGHEAPAPRKSNGPSDARRARCCQ